MRARELVKRARVAVTTTHSLRSLEWERRDLVVVQLHADNVEASLSNPPDAIVLDLATSDARTRSGCWQLHDLLDVPVIVLIDDGSVEQRVALLERGADDVLVAPVDPRVLAACVAAVLRRSRRETAPGIPGTLHLDGVEVDLVRRTVYRERGTQSLSRTEFNLLVALMRANGRACTHRELIAQVWGTNASAAGHYLRLYIRYLREKLEEDPRQPRRIVNVWGTGYRLILSRDGAHGSAPPATAAIVGSGDAVSPVSEVTWKPRSLLSPRLRPTAVTRPVSVSAATT